MHMLCMCYACVMHVLCMRDVGAIVYACKACEAVMSCSNIDRHVLIYIRRRRCDCWMKQLGNRRGKWHQYERRDCNLRQNRRLDY